MGVIERGEKTFIIIAITIIIITIIMMFFFGIHEKKCISDYNNNVILEEGSTCRGHYLNQIQLKEINKKVLSN